MRKQIRGLLLGVAFWLVPGVVYGQFNYQEVPESLGYLPGPLGHPRFENGGFFLAGEFAYFHETNPIRSQTIAVRGFSDTLGNLGVAPGGFLGSATEALNSQQVNGPVSFQPGFNLVGGWRFGNGVVVQLGWLHLAEANYAASASILPPGNTVGPQLADTFLFSPVFNFPSAFAGAPVRIAGSANGELFGIWNGAAQETIRFIQRFDQFDLTGRFPLWQTENYRNYALFGPRIVGMWERFIWRTISTDPDGNAAPNWAATYNNVVSNRLYGLHVGGGHEFWLGDTPVGGFSISLDGEVGLFYDFVKERANYTLDTRNLEYTHNRNTAKLSPEVQGGINLWWWPFQAVQVHVGYNVMAFFNTVSSRQPVDFNFGQIAPGYNSTTRLLHGLMIGAGVVF